MLPLRPRRSLRPLPRRPTRRALVWYAAALALTLVTAGTVHGSLRSAAQAEAAYGETVRVVVATAPIAPGEPVDASVAEARALPRAVVPRGALRAPVEGRVALVALSPGEIVLARRVAGPDAEGLAARLAQGQRAVPVPVAVPGLELSPGDRVDVVAGGAPGAGPEGDLPVAGAPQVVAADAEVLSAGEEVVVVAVAARAADDLAAALTAGPLVVALRPPAG